MPQTKKSNTKNTKVRVATPAVQEDDELKDSAIISDKKIIDVDAVLEPALIEEKGDDEVPVVTEDAEEGGDEISLDDEELNPFGDKWEQ